MSHAPALMKDDTEAASPPAGAGDDIYARVAGKNINEKTLLATDYLNHFNEIIMLIELVPDLVEYPGVVGGNLTLGTSFIRLQSWLEVELARDVTLTSLLSVGKDAADFGLGRFVFDIVRYPIQMRSEFSFRLARGITLNTGLDFQVAPFDILVRAPPPPRPGEPSPGPFTTRPLLETRQSSTFFRPAWYTDAQLRFDRTTLTPGFRVDYVAIRDPETLEPLFGPIRGPARVLGAVHLGATRLIDNVPTAPKNR